MGTHNIKQPTDHLFEGGKVQFNPAFAREYTAKFNKAQEYIDRNVIRLSTVPKRSGALEASATLHTQIGSGNVRWVTPYARRQYYEHATLSQWFETMKNRHKDKIMKGVKEIIAE